MSSAAPQAAAPGAAASAGPPPVVVLGAGAWGTALAIQAARAGAAPVLLWARDPVRAAAIAATRENPRLPGRAVPAAVRVTSELPDRAAAWLLAVPMQHLRGVAARLAPAAPLVCCAKGVEAGTLRLPLEILAELHPGARAVVLTGPNFAHEIAAGLPAAAVVAGADAALRAAVTALLASPTFRLYGNDDPVGAQLGGAAKNVIAIAAGAVMGAGLGENARAALITRGLAELGRLAVALGGRAETVMGLSGLGDLLLTCTGASSRNYSLGVALGRGTPLAAVMAQRSAVTEGVATAPALVARAGAVDLPICRAVAAWLEGRITLHEAIADLLARQLRDE
ncbi:MAG: NAD(P)H-dependent glycerol-3-phosphate dehydrogenase [Rhodospirillales bacterium]|jgi:glycerol-3-phosphate dehydrogenase (NAD(P)+)|nr:NAD(P)H-dependent glycerol-3-phosphate dehydrogenase [Rhodospirillales bacterium]